MAKQPRREDDADVTMGDLDVREPDDDNSPPVDDNGSDRSGDDDQPELVEITINGHKMKVEKEVAEAYEAEREEMEREMREQQKAAKPQEPSRSDDETDDDDLFWSDPKAWKEKVKQEVKEEIRSEYSADQSQRDFWRDFYKSNPDLEENDDIVQAVLNKNYETLGPMKTDKAIERLAELTHKKILSIAQAHGGGGKKNDTATLEGGGGSDKDVPSKQEQSQEPEDDLPKSLGEAIKLRKRQRLKAAG